MDLVNCINCGMVAPTAQNACPSCQMAIEPAATLGITPQASDSLAWPQASLPAADMQTPAPALPPLALQYESRRPRSANGAELLTNVCVCKADAPFYGTMHPLAQPLGMVMAGELFSIGIPLTERGVTRVGATLSDGSRVLLAGDARVFTIRAVRLQSQTIMYSGPSLSSPLIETLRGGTDIVLVDQVTLPNGNLLSEIRDQNGRTGYIDGKTKVLRVAAGKNPASKDMLVGGVICIAGIMITIITYSLASSSSGGGTYIIAWGPAIFGAIQFFKGLARLGESAPPSSLLDRLIRQIVREKTGTR